MANLYKGLALQVQFRVEDDLMTEALPMETDYGVHGLTFIAKEVPGDDNLEPAGLYLVGAKTMLDKQPGDSVAKVDVLSALGELELKKRNYMDSFKHYREALSIMERLVEPDNQRIAHLYPFPSLKAPRNFKICMCLAKCNDIKQATEYCVKAISICKNRIQRLNSSPGPSSSAPDAGLSLLDKAGDIGKFELLLREFERKLLILQHPMMSSSPTDSSFDSPNINTRMQKQSGIEASGTKRQLSPDPASKEPMSATSKQPGGPEHSPPTAGKEVKRQLFPDSSSTESTPTKKHSLGPSSTEEDKEGTP
ncbi:uncharacterized protein LOC132277782 [Cornus florida]|uniref:uncharacterized protein LOC132277782 n=1 Tax=Cornus florida TaxID=4283 RepID=UPI00289900D7|nr:uncharacterized protein LOC132277782 [Cornus florida]